MKLCLKCNRTLDVLQFGNRKKNLDGLQNWCKECFNEANRQYYANNTSAALIKSREQWYVRKYGITLAQKQIMLQLQNYLCMICERVMELNNKCHVDHDHETGKVRGLLCNKCNTGLYYIENSNYLEKAKGYLRKYEAIRT